MLSGAGIVIAIDNDAEDEEVEPSINVLSMMMDAARVKRSPGNAAAGRGNARSTRSNKKTNAKAGVEANPVQVYTDQAEFGEKFLGLLYVDICGCRALDDTPCRNGTCPDCFPTGKNPKRRKHNIVSDCFNWVLVNHRHCDHCGHQT